MSADHKRPMFAFVLVMLACVLIIANGLRSEAFVGMLRAQADRVVAGVELVPVRIAPDRATHRQPAEPPVLAVTGAPASTAPTVGEPRSTGSAAQHPSVQLPSAGHPSTGHTPHPQAAHQHGGQAAGQGHPHQGHPHQGHVKQVHVKQGQVERDPVGQTETTTHELAHQVGQQVGQLLGRRGSAAGRGQQGRGDGRGRRAGLVAVQLPGQHLGPRWARRR